jgi:hypothetical protein
MQNKEYKIQEKDRCHLLSMIPNGNENHVFSNFYTHRQTHSRGPPMSPLCRPSGTTTSSKKRQKKQDPGASASQDQLERRSKITLKPTLHPEGRGCFHPYKQTQKCRLSTRQYSLLFPVDPPVQRKECKGIRRKAQRLLPISNATSLSSPNEPLQRVQSIQKSQMRAVCWVQTGV